MPDSTSDEPQPLPSGQVTRLLHAMKDGEGEAAQRVFSLLYDELHALAERLMTSQPNGQTIQATVLVNEAYLRLANLGADWEGRSHFMAVAARAMRSVLVDGARRRHAQKRDRRRLISLDGLGNSAASTDDSDTRSLNVLALHDALSRLGEIDGEAERVVELRFFGGLAMSEIAEQTGLSLRTAERKWRTARAFLHRELAQPS